MGKWTREKVNSENLNGGNQYEAKDRLSREQLNAMVNSGLYAQDFAEHLADTPDTSEANNVGVPTVELVENGKYKKFKFSNLKGEKGDRGDRGEKGETGGGVTVNNVTTGVNFTSDPQTQINNLNEQIKTLQSELDKLLPYEGRENVFRIGYNLDFGTDDDYIEGMSWAYLMTGTYSFVALKQYLSKLETGTVVPCRLVVETNTDSRFICNAGEIVVQRNSPTRPNDIYLTQFLPFYMITASGSVRDSQMYLKIDAAWNEDDEIRTPYSYSANDKITKLYIELL